MGSSQVRALRRAAWALTVPAALIVAGCGGSTSNTSNFPVDPLISATSDDGALAIQAWTAPNQPPTRGTVSVKLLITDATTHAPVDGLSVSLTPVMPAMGHGSSLVPVVTAEGGGVYVAENVGLYMAGRWDLGLSVLGHGSPSVALPVDVQ